MVCDPYADKWGKYPKDVEADVVTVSHDHPDHNAIDKIGAKPFIISGPGEYEVKGISVIGVSSYHDENNGTERGMNTMFVIEVDGLRVGHLGDLGHKLSQGQLEELGSIDVLLLPIGGKYTIDAKQAAEVLRQVDPWVVIPMHYAQEGMDTADLTGIADFLKEIGKGEIEPVAKYVMTADRLPTELQVVVMSKK